MGYYARGSGSIRFSHLTDKEIEDVEVAVGEIFEDYDAQGANDTENGWIIDFWMDDKYHSEPLETMLANFARRYDIEDGSIQFMGEDDCIWRFLYVKEKNCFIEQEGRIVYE